MHCMYKILRIYHVVWKIENLSGPNYQIEATLGQQHGNNLFHSFQDFNLRNNNEAIKKYTF